MDHDGHFVGNWWATGLGAVLYATDAHCQSFDHGHASSDVGVLNIKSKSSSGEDQNYRNTAQGRCCALWYSTRCLMPRPRPALGEPAAPSNQWPELLTVREAATLLTVSVARVRHFQASRFIPFYKIGGCVRFAKSDLLSFLVAQRVDSIDRV